MNEESSFEKLKEDPCAIIKKHIKTVVCDFEKRNLLTHDDVFDMTGVTKKGGVSHGREFIVHKLWRQCNVKPGNKEKKKEKREQNI